VNILWYASERVFDQLDVITWQIMRVLIPNVTMFGQLTIRGVTADDPDWSHSLEIPRVGM
jgi:hypothetical protein